MYPWFNASFSSTDANVLAYMSFKWNINFLSELSGSIGTYIFLGGSISTLTNPKNDPSFISLTVISTYFENPTAYSSNEFTVGYNDTTS